jgi:uncharacterized protein
MTPEEKSLISGLFDRLGQASNQPKDAEADQLIRSKVAEIPEAPYLLVQSTLVMQQALSNAQSRIAALEKQIAEAKTSVGAQQSGGSFLSGVASFFGGGQSHGQPQRAAPPPPPPSAPPPVPMQPAQPSAYAYSPQPPPAQGRPGGGFLQGALTTAAGVAGGALLFQGIESLIGHNPGPFAGAVGPSGGFLGGERPVENTEITNYYVEEDPNRGQVDPRDAQADLDNPDQTAASERDDDPGSTDDYTSDDNDFGGDDGGGGGDDSSYV